MASLRGERIAEYLLDRIEAVDQGEIFNQLAIEESHEVCDPENNIPAILTTLRRLAIEHRDSVAVHQDGLRNKTEDAKHLRHLTLDQVDHGRLAPVGSAEAQIVDRSADGPFHIVMQKLRNLFGIAGGVDLVKGINYRPRHGISHGELSPIAPSQRRLCLNFVSHKSLSAIRRANSRWNSGQR